MTVRFEWELPGQNISYGDGLYVTNTTAGAPRVSVLFESYFWCAILTTCSI